MATNRVNLIGNDGGLENGTLFLGAQAGTLTYDKIGYASWGNRSVTLTSNNATVTSAAVVTVPISGQKMLTVSYDLVNDTTVDTASAFSTYIAWRDGNNGVISTQAIVSPNGMGVAPSRVVAKFTSVPAGAVTGTLYLGTALRAIGSWTRFDNIWVDGEDTDGSWPYPKSPMLIPGHFDSGTLPISIARGAGEIVSPKVAGGGYGDGVGKITASGTNCYLTTAMAPITPGQTVTIAMDVKDPKLTSSNTGYILVNFYSGATSKAQIHRQNTPTTVTHMPPQDGGQWHRIVQTFTAPEGAAQFNTALCHLGGARVAGDVFYLDRLSIEVGLTGETPPGLTFPYPDVTTGDYCLVNDEKTGDLWFTLKPGSTRLGGPKIVVQNGEGYFTLEWDIVVNPGESLVVDCQEKTSKINGVNYPPLVREWPVLATGENWFSLRAAEASTGSTMDITYHLGS